ncbi:MAG: dienelactone hydrolase [Flavobacteriales bacterium]|jgi:dienelactone hydrolase
MYYGMSEKDTELLSTLKCDVLGIFASKDGWITADVVSRFEKDLLALDRGVYITFLRRNMPLQNLAILNRTSIRPKKRMR